MDFHRSLYHQVTWAIDIALIKKIVGPEGSSIYLLMPKRELAQQEFARIVCSIHLGPSVKILFLKEPGSDNVSSLLEFQVTLDGLKYSLGHKLFNVASSLLIAEVDSNFVSSMVKMQGPLGNEYGTCFVPIDFMVRR